MRQAYRIISIYTADVSGVCSALYELGGMTVMHDPSGCNSTYNTHDEIRWYEQDSLIYISGLTEIDAIMGNDEKLIHDTVTAAQQLNPRFIALAGSPIPYINGTDFPAIASVIEAEAGIPVFSVPTNGMHDYVYGAGIALEKIAERFTNSDVKCTDCRSVNLLGVTPLDFGPQSHVDVMKKNLENKGWKIRSTWAMGDEFEALANSGEAAVNVVVSSVGIRAAEVLKKKFGTPYVIGTPVGDFTGKLSEAMERAVQKGICEIPYLSGRLEGEAEICLIGEAVMTGSLAAAVEEKYQRPVRVLCPLRETDGLLAPGDIAVRGEEEMENHLKSAKVLVADPLYRPICPEGCQLYELPHIAFSGRIYLKKLPVFASLCTEG